MLDGLTLQKISVLLRIVAFVNEYHGRKYPAVYIQPQNIFVIVVHVGGKIKEKYVATR